MSIITARATATRSGNWWAIDVLYDGQEYHSQAKRLEHVPAMAADVVAMLTGTDPSDVLVSLVVDVPDVDIDVNEVEKAADEAAEAAARASYLSRTAVADLTAAGLSVRDIGKILDISPQRVSQLAARAEGKVPATPSRERSKSRSWKWADHSHKTH